MMIFRTSAFFGQTLWQGSRGFSGVSRNEKTLSALFYKKIYFSPSSLYVAREKEVFVPSHNLFITRARVRNFKEPDNKPRLVGSEGFGIMYLGRLKVPETLVVNMKQLANEEEAKQGDLRKVDEAISLLTAAFWKDVQNLEG